MNIVISETSPTTHQIVMMASIVYDVAGMYPYRDMVCVFCGESDKHDNHSSDCPYKMAQKLMDELNIKYVLRGYQK